MYYKVVRQRGEELVSACNNPIVLPSDWIVTYKPNEWAEPVIENTLLFCFNIIEDAIDFICNELRFAENVSLWECEVDGEIKQITRLSSIAFYINMFWEENKDVPLIRKAPPSTVGVSRIKLTKQLDLDDLAKIY